jgi:hypothetical protein
MSCINTIQWWVRLKCIRVINNKHHTVLVVCLVFSTFLYQIISVLDPSVFSVHSFVVRIPPPPQKKPYFVREWKYAKYTVLRVSMCNTWNSFLNIRQKVLNLWSKCSICVCKVRLLSSSSPRNFTVLASVRIWPAYVNYGGWVTEWNL